MRFIVLVVLFISLETSAQVDPARIQIARDSFGVPHVFAPTDAGVAYGIAWAHAEDDFKTLQTVVLMGKGKMGTALGKKGAQADYAIRLLRCRQLVDAQWETMGKDFIAVMKGYVDGLNAYAKAHPSEILYKKAFPFNEKEYLTAVVFSTSIFCGVDKVLPQIIGGTVKTIPGFASEGSNAFVFHPQRTNTGESFLTINAHQPIEGMTAFYEAHLQSEEGWNMLGGLFPGGCLIFHGTNENLGWAHTVNYQDKIDVYQLEMNPKNNNQYKFDGEWVDLESEKIKLEVKGVPVKVGRTIYWSKYGATMKTKKGVFSMRLPANMDCRGLEQWFRMNKARNFTEFYKALSMTSLPMFNIMYADRNDTIFYISNGKMPVRNPDPAYNWKSTLPGNTSKTLWTEFKPVTALPQYLNPKNGFLFNTNHSPFLATDNAANNLNGKDFDPKDGFETFNNNRSIRVGELMAGIDKMDYETMKKIKFDQQLPAKLEFPYGLDHLMNLKAADYPALRNVIENLQHWDHKAVTNSKGAAVFLLVYDFLSKKLLGADSRDITKEEAVETYEYVNNYMLKYFKKTDITLGELQKLVRGNDARPAWGLPDVLTAEYSAPYKDGLRRVTSGDAYICFVRYPKQGLPIIESINTFGASSNPSSPHYKDQMEMFQKQQLKPMTLDKALVLKNAKSVYSPVKK